MTNSEKTKTNNESYNVFLSAKSIDELAEKLLKVKAWLSGQPYELLILDAPTIESAVNVWRWNVGGLGFSKNGYNGPYDTAITSDGQIVADFITSGSLTANIIKAGVISSFDNSSWWDLESGEVHLKAYASTETVKEINEKIYATDKRVDETNDKIDAVNNQLDGVRGTISTVIEKTAELQINADQIRHHYLTALKRFQLTPIPYRFLSMLLFTTHHTNII